MIKLVVIDFDGVFTNGQVMFDNNGSPIKSYNVKDYVGIKLLYNEDIKFGVISGYKDNLSQIRDKIDNQDINFYIDYIINSLFEAKIGWKVGKNLHSGMSKTYPWVCSQLNSSVSNQ